MKIALEISEDHECTESPWWIIVDPRPNMALDVHALASMVTGPFFSRMEAEEFLERTRYNFSNRAVVYCKSGYASDQYKTACRAGDQKRPKMIGEVCHKCWNGESCFRGVKEWVHGGFGNRVRCKASDLRDLHLGATPTPGVSW